MIIHDSKIDNKNKILPYLLICLITIIIYLPSFTGEFILDDIPLVKNAEYHRAWHSLGSYLTQEDGYDKYSDRHTGYYRPLINIFYALDYKVWGLCAPGFRITNLVLHLFTCFSLFVLFNLLFRRRDIALMLAVLFSLHPANTETASWITSRNNILATLFGILSLIFYIQSYKKHKYLDYIFSIFFFALAVFSKEFGLMMLPIFFLYQRFLNNNRQSIFIEFREYIPFMLIAAVYFVMRYYVTGVFLLKEGSSDVIGRIFNAPYVLFLNLKLIFLPFKPHSYILDYPEKLHDLRTLIPIFCFFIGIILIFIYRKNRFLLFSTGAFLISLFPVLGIMQTSAPSLIAMRWLYFPMPFILIILFQPFERYLKINRFISMCVFFGIILYLSINSFTLNKYLWHSSDTFFRQEVLHFKNYFYSDGLADIYKEEEKPDLAMKYYKKSFESGIQRAINYFDYANLLIEKGDPEKALKYLERARPICFSSDKLGLFYHLKGIAFLKLGKLEESEKNMLKAINLTPEEPAYWENLGVIKGKMGNHSEALASFEKAITIGLNSDTIYKNMANGYLLMNECGKAVKLINRVSKGKKDAGLNNLLRKAEKCLERQI